MSTFAKPRVLAIVGPTAVGKSEVALSLAIKLGGEIISADSMQVYKGLDIATAKPSLAERLLCPHHLIDVVDSTEKFSAADYQRLARAAVQEIIARGKLPIFCGGTGLYLRAALDEYNFTAIASSGESSTARMRLQQEIREVGLSALHIRLKSVDPKVAARVDQHDERRILRALEVFETTGRPLSSWEAEKDIGTSIYDMQIIGLNRPRAELYARIDARVEHMLHSGLLDEAKKCFEQGLSYVSEQALGYKELYPYFKGETTLAEAAEKLKRQTRRYAKRQLSWFRADARVRWVEAVDLKAAESIILRILAIEWGIAYN